MSSLSVSGPSSMTLHEATEAARVVADHADTEADIIFGAIVDDDLGEEMKVTVIAAGFERRRQGRPATSRPSTPLVLRVRRGGRRPRHPDLRPGMNQPPGVDGAAFTDATDGDQRNDLRCAVRGVVLVGDLTELGHGQAGPRGLLIHAETAGELDDADAIWSDVPGLPLAVFTADCFGVVLRAESAVGVAHAGWRGASAGVVLALREEMTRQGHEPIAAAIGPGIGPCCFEVGPDVAERFPQDLTETRWGATSVDLAGSLRRQLEGLEVWLSGACTMHETGFYSHRRSRTALRNATITWVA